MTNKNTIPILHLSDLHICDEAVRPHLEKLQKLFEEVSSDAGLSIKIDLTFSSEDRLKEIKEAVKELQPSIICISGDLTTFGDNASFNKATNFLEALSLSSNSGCKIVVTPGNHDVLCSQLKALIDNGSRRFNDLGIWGRLLFKTCGKLLSKQVKSDIELSALRKYIIDILEMEEVQPDCLKPLKHYQQLTSSAFISNGNESVGDISGCDVRCIPFDSVSLEPLWMNLGFGRRDEFLKYRARLRQVTKGPRSVVLALLHHNPISSAEIIESPVNHAYNSFPAASTYVKEMQDAGTDIIFYGHQHHASICKIDFIPSEPGHLYLIGASSAATLPGGFNVIHLFDRFHGTVQRYKFTDAGRHIKDGNEEPLIFECQRVKHTETIASRYEVRYFARLDEDAVEKERRIALEPGATELFIVRPRGQHLADKESIDALRNILNHPKTEKVRILVADPGLFDLIKSLPNEQKKRLSRMWGPTHSWEDQAKKATDTLNVLESLKKDLPKNIFPKLEIRKSHSLFPVGAIVRTEGAGKKQMFLRLLPVGTDIRRRELRLEIRHEDGLSQFYDKYLEALWIEAGNEEKSPQLNAGKAEVAG